MIRLSEHEYLQIFLHTKDPEIRGRLKATAFAMMYGSATSVLFVVGHAAGSFTGE